MFLWEAHQLMWKGPGRAVGDPRLKMQHSSPGHSEHQRLLLQAGTPQGTSQTSLQSALPTAPKVHAVAIPVYQMSNLRLTEVK